MRPSSLKKHKNRKLSKPAPFPEFKNNLPFITFDYGEEINLRGRPLTREDLERAFEEIMAQPTQPRPIVDWGDYPLTIMAS